MSPFLNQLSAEVRLEIYKDLFRGCEYPFGSMFEIPGSFNFDLWHGKASRNRSQKPIVNILQVCEQIRSEATPTFQSLVKIVFADEYPIVSPRSFPSTRLTQVA